jgi:general secretion pathway protein D
VSLDFKNIHRRLIWCAFLFLFDFLGLQSVFADQKTSITNDFSVVKGEHQSPKKSSTEAFLEPVVDEDGKEVVFDFEKVKLKNFIDFISQMKGLSYIPNSDAGEVETSLSMNNPMTEDEAYKVFLTVLESAGFSHIKVGDIYKIIKSDAKYTEPLPIYMGKSSTELGDSDETVRFVTFFRNLALSDVEPILKSMLTPGAQIIPLQSLNGAVITDRALKIKSVMRLINEIDNSGLEEAVSIIRLSKASAFDVKDLIEQIIKKPDGSALARILGGSSESNLELFSSAVKIEADEINNNLILMGTRSALSRIEDFIVNYIDKSLKQPETPLHIYECQFVDAEQIKTILDEVVRGDNSASKSGSASGGAKYFGRIKVEADKFGNRLIVSCDDKNDWRLMHEIILDLDKPQPQVAIETLIVSVEQANSKTLGGQIRNRSDGSPIPGVNFQNSHVAQIQPTEGLNGNVKDILGNLINSVSTLSRGSVLLSLGPGNDIWSLFRAINTVSNASIVDKGFITVANRVTGEISTGNTRRIEAENAVSENTQNRAPSFTNAEAKTKISYTPQINSEGLINLQVDVDIVDFISTSGGDTTNKTIQNTVTVADVQVLVLGGFVKTKVTESSTRDPLLSRVPVLGWLFKNKQKSIEKSYVFIFVSPTIVKPRQSPGVGLYSKMKLHDAFESVERSVQVRRSRDPIHNWFFNPEREDYSHKVVDFANARYQPTTVDLDDDSYYRSSKDVPALSGNADQNVTYSANRSGVINLKKEGEKKESLHEKRDRLKGLVRLGRDGTVQNFHRETKFEAPEKTIVEKKDAFAKGLVGEAEQDSDVKNRLEEVIFGAEKLSTASQQTKDGFSDFLQGEANAQPQGQENHLTSLFEPKEMRRGALHKFISSGDATAFGSGFTDGKKGLASLVSANDSGAPKQYSDVLSEDERSLVNFLSEGEIEPQSGKERIASKRKLLRSLVDDDLASVDKSSTPKKEILLSALTKGGDEG